MDLHEFCIWIINFCKCTCQDLASGRNLQILARRLLKLDLARFIASVTCGILQVLVSLSCRKIYLKVLARSCKSYLLNFARSSLNKRLASSCHLLVPGLSKHICKNGFSGTGLMQHDN